MCLAPSSQRKLCSFAGLLPPRYNGGKFTVCSFVLLNKVLSVSPLSIDCSDSEHHQHLSRLDHPIFPYMASTHNGVEVLEMALVRVLHGHIVHHELEAMCDSFST